VSFAAYVLTILIGGFLLTLPVCRQPGRPPVTFVDGVFTATSACCVTGLTVRSTPGDFSFLGQALILALIQLGGLGIMTITTLVSFHIGGEATLHQRAVIAETLGIRSGRDLRWVTFGVLLTVLLAELLGFGLLCWADWGRGPVGGVVWRSLFHSVSAFCNAGFALHDDNLVPDAGRGSINLVICGLIIVGGLGFPVIFDIFSRLRRREPFWDRLHTQSKMMLIGTALLLAVGAASFWLLEWRAALDRESTGTKLWMGLFHSTTCRTAGFNTVRYIELSSATLFLAIVLMAIGAGPCSTAGGFKVSTFMTLVVSSWANFRGGGPAGHGHGPVLRGGGDRGPRRPAGGRVAEHGGRGVALVPQGPVRVHFGARHGRAVHRPDAAAHRSRQARARRPHAPGPARPDHRRRGPGP
jgi:trk system potassium uptake protein TrkH